ncbi:hypothetical protein FS749_008117 [Ceratobasidium sp. UAMH 11750]|nr:hypothetical protein FS749_008117 [Ceratobasidium sp. UAMH 11750]
MCRLSPRSSLHTTPPTAPASTPAPTVSAAPPTTISSPLARGVHRPDNVPEPPGRAPPRAGSTLNEPSSGWFPGLVWRATVQLAVSAVVTVSLGSSASAHPTKQISPAYMDPPGFSPPCQGHPSSSGSGWSSITPEAVSCLSVLLPTAGSLPAGGLGTA